MLVTDHNGMVDAGRTGLFDHDTQYLGTYRLLIDEFDPIFLTHEKINHNVVVLSYTNPKFRSGSTFVEELDLSIRVIRCIDGGLHECFEITSFAPGDVQFRWMVHLECTFQSIETVRGLTRVVPRVTRSQYDARRRVLTVTFRDSWFRQALEYHIKSADSAARHSPNLLIFPVRLSHAQTWRAEVFARCTVDPIENRHVYNQGRTPETTFKAATQSQDSSVSVTGRIQQIAQDTETWVDRMARIETSNTVVQRAYDQALRDLASLRFELYGGSWYPAAGVPWFNAIFGRDALTAAYQTLAIGDPFSLPVLTRLAELQGSSVNTWNDEEPGKILHEMRVSQPSLMGKVPFHPFYGTVDAPLLFVILLSEVYRFSGDLEMVRQFLGAAERCLSWAATYGDIDGDGFIEYWMRGPHDYHNQGWKDAWDAVVYPDGSIVPDPIAIVEVQGYYYDALRRAAELYRGLGMIDKATTSDRHADRLQSAFEKHFWLAPERFYAFGLDPKKRPICSIASNPGQLLWSGIVRPERAALVAQRLMAPDLFCGWGIRTLSSTNGGYDPLSYQRGSLWPHDNALIALGLKRYGHWRETNRIAEGIFAASSSFAQAQLPELWAGLDRDQTQWPVLYPMANVPQAWAAGAIPLILRAILGCEPDIASGTLWLWPTLPDWLPDITFRGLSCPGGSCDVRCSGRGLETRIDVLARRGNASIELGPFRRSRT